MEFSVGDKVMLKSTSRRGFVMATERRRTPMVEVKWEDDGLKQWLPADQFRPWDVLDAPTTLPRTSKLGRTTPDYIIQLRRSKQVQDEYHERRKRPKLDKMADRLCSLSDCKKQRSWNNAQRIIGEFTQRQEHREQPAKVKRTITREEVFAGRSRRGGWKYDQLRAWGVKTPPKHGWIDRLVREGFWAYPDEPTVAPRPARTYIPRPKVRMAKAANRKMSTEYAERLARD